MTPDALIDTFSSGLQQAHADLRGTVSSADAMSLRQVSQPGMTPEARAMLLLQVRQPALIGLTLAALLMERQQRSSAA